MLYYVTGNQNKIAVAEKFLTPLGIEFQNKELDIIEIQSHSIEEIAIHKAKQAFTILQNPLFVNDHGWSITALNGFPGAYMKYMNEWLSKKDFLSLMGDKDNREAILTEVLCYIDDSKMETFTMVHKGKVLYEAQGEGPPGLTSISLTSDNQSIAKRLENSPSAVDDYPLWEKFARWYKTFH